MVYCNLAAGNTKFVYLVNERVSPNGEFYNVDDRLSEEEKEDEAQRYFKNYCIKDVCDESQGQWVQTKDTGFWYFIRKKGAPPIAFTSRTSLPRIEVPPPPPPVPRTSSTAMYDKPFSLGEEVHPNWTERHRRDVEMRTTQFQFPRREPVPSAVWDELKKFPHNATQIRNTWQVLADKKKS